MTRYGIVQWNDFDNLYDVIALTSNNVKNTNKNKDYVLSATYQTLDRNDGKYYAATLLKIGTKKECETKMESIESYEFNRTKNNEIKKSQKRVIQEEESEEDSENEIETVISDKARAIVEKRKNINKTLPSQFESYLLSKSNNAQSKRDHLYSDSDEEIPIKRTKNTNKDNSNEKSERVKCSSSLIEELKNENKMIKLELEKLKVEKSSLEAELERSREKFNDLKAATSEFEKKKMLSFCESFYSTFATNEDILRLCANNGINQEQEFLISTRYPQFKISKRVKNMMEQLFEEKGRTHRSCFRRLLCTFVNPDIFIEKNHEAMKQEYAELINACHEYVQNHYENFNHKEVGKALRELHSESAKKERERLKQN